MINSDTEPDYEYNKYIFRQPPVEVLREKIHHGPSPIEIEQEKQEKEYKEHCLRELRNYFRMVLTYLEREKRYKAFVDPIDKEEVPDYYTIIKNPICLNDIFDKVDEKKYSTINQFMSDIDLLVNNAKEYNPNNKEGKEVVRAAIQLKDDVLSYQHRFSIKIGYDLFGECDKFYEQDHPTIDESIPIEIEENNNNEQQDNTEVVTKLRHACDHVSEILPQLSRIF